MEKFLMLRLKGVREKFVLAETAGTALVVTLSPRGKTTEIHFALTTREVTQDMPGVAQAYVAVAHVALKAHIVPELQRKFDVAFFRTTPNGIEFGLCVRPGTTEKRVLLDIVEIITIIEQSLMREIRYFGQATTRAFGEVKMRTSMFRTPAIASRSANPS